MGEAPIDVPIEEAPPDAPTTEVAAAPRSPIDLFRRSEAELLLLRGTAEAGTVFSIPPQGASVGRRQGDLLFPDDPYLQPLAASFSYRSEILFVCAEGPGVYIRIHRQARLEAGAHFAIGDHLLRLGGIVSKPQDADERVHGAPLPAEGPFLLVEVLLAGGRPGPAHLLPSPVRIGRREGEILIPQDRFISGRHCALYLDGDQVLLEDLQSTNGTFVALPPGVWTPIRRGDTLRLGQNILRVR